MPNHHAPAAPLRLPHHPLHHLALPIFAVCSLPALAQTVPDAGVLQRESGQQLQAPGPALRIAPAAPMKAEAKGVRVQVKGFVIEGARLIPADELAGLLADQIGQSLTLAELERVAQRIAGHYFERGWFARVYLPAQDVTDGRIRIAVVEGRLGSLKSDDSGAKRANAEAVLRQVGHRLVIGQPLSAAQLERNLLIANDLPGIKATGVLEAGGQPGETGLRVKVEDTPLLSGDLGLNNHGLDSTGRWQGTGGLALNSPGGRGDRLELRLLGSQRLASGQVRYGLPLGLEGTRLSLYGSLLGYTLGDDYAALDAKGRAHTYGLSLAHPLQRSERRNLRLQFGAERRQSQDESLGAVTRRHDIDALNLGLSGDRLNADAGRLTQYGLTLTAGQLDLDSVAADYAADQAGPRSHGRYAKANAQWSLLQRLPAQLSLNASLSGQWAADNLDSSEKFALGGPAAIRAYPGNEASGDSGWLARVELARRLGQTAQLGLFVETGGVRLHSDPWAGWEGTGTTPNTYRLSGAGLSLSWQTDTGWSLQLAAAKPLSDNPGRDANDDNSDGSDQHSARAWVNLAKRF